MAKISLAILAAGFVAAAVPAQAAKTDCDGKFKDFMGKMTTYMPDMIPRDFAESIRKSLKVYDTCNAGDDLGPYGLWNDILADAAKKAGK